MRPQLKFLLLLIAFVLSPIWASAYETVKNPQPVDDPQKLEVIEFFNYGCPHCADLFPLINAWEKTLKEDVVLRRVPVSFGRAAWGNTAKLFYTLEAMNERERLESKVFNAIHKERVNLFVPKLMNDWIIQQNVDVNQFNATFNSFGVMNSLKRAEKLTQDYALEGVPALVVNGKYLVSGADKSVLQEVDALLQKERELKGK